MEPFRHELRWRYDAIELIRFKVSNPGDREQVARLMFEKSARGFRQHFGTPITGLSAVLRDRDGFPTGIPVQLSKNWHNDPAAGVYSGQWLHGVTQVPLRAGETKEFELAIVYGHWGGVAAASHSQLSLIGWGANQRWDESALGAWGESICYEPEQLQGKCSITDVRPVMVTPKNGKGKWGWTNNVGGGDFFRMFDRDGQRIVHSEMRATYLKQGPCLTEVIYAGKIGEGIEHSETVSLSRTDDIVRGKYVIRLKVREAVDFSRFVIFQVGADTYNMTNEAKFALGNKDGLIKEWPARKGGLTMKCGGSQPWISLHEGAPRSEKKSAGAWANRGIVIRSWRARLGGKEVGPWMVEHDNGKSSTTDLVPPPDLKRLEPGDFVEAVIEYLVMPQAAGDYYGPNEELRAALAKDANTWKMIHREAADNDRRIVMKTGSVVDGGIGAENDSARFVVENGIGYVPVTITGLSAARGYVLKVDGKVLDQSVHGNDFWQTDYDPALRRWSRTYNIPMSSGQSRQIKLSKETKP